jgi:hypothetical protein
MFGIGKKKISLTAHQRSQLIFNTSMFTPDMPLLEGYQRSLLFVADDWMRNSPSRFILSELGAMHECTAYTMRSYKYLVDPSVVIPSIKSRMPKSLILQVPEYGYKIEGEVLSLPNPARAFSILDKLRQNTVECHRRRVHILYPTRSGWKGENFIQPGTFIHDTGFRGISWNGKFPYGHPLAGVKEFPPEQAPEKVFVLSAYMYVADPQWWRIIYRNPERFDEPPKVTSELKRKWLSDFYRYDPQRYKDR